MWGALCRRRVADRPEHAAASPNLHACVLCPVRSYPQGGVPSNSTDAAWAGQRGALWVAQRVPSGHVAVVANSNLELRLFKVFALQVLGPQRQVFVVVGGRESDIILRTWYKHTFRNAK